MKARNEETVEDVQANGRGDASARMRQEERVITSRGRDAIYFYLQKHRYTALVTSFVYLPVFYLKFFFEPSHLINPIFKEFLDRPTATRTGKRKSKDPNFLSRTGAWPCKLGVHRVVWNI